MFQNDSHSPFTDSILLEGVGGGWVGLKALPFSGVPEEFVIAPDVRGVIPYLPQPVNVSSNYILKITPVLQREYASHPGGVIGHYHGILVFAIRRRDLII